MEKTNAMRMLEQAGVTYAVHVYGGGALSGVEVAAALGEPPGRVYKTLVTVGSPRRLYVFVIPVGAELDLKKAARAAGEKAVAMLPLKELFPLTGYVHGGCSPLGMKKRYPTFFQFGAEEGTVFVSGGKIGLQIEAAGDALAGACGASFADLVRD